MKVKDLIKLLNKADPNKEVYFAPDGDEEGLNWETPFPELNDFVLTRDNEFYPDRETMLDSGQSTKGAKDVVVISMCSLH